MRQSLRALTGIPGIDPDVVTRAIKGKRGDTDRSAPAPRCPSPLATESEVVRGAMNRWKEDES
jgi:hypothetical protein